MREELHSGQWHRVEVQKKKGNKKVSLWKRFNVGFQSPSRVRRASVLQGYT